MQAKVLNKFRNLVVLMLTISYTGFFFLSLKIAFAGYQPAPSISKQSKQQKLQKIKNLINTYYIKSQKTRHQLYQILVKLNNHSFSDPKKEDIKRQIINQIKKSKYSNLNNLLHLDKKNLDSPPSKCMKYFDQLDQLGVKYNFPPELIIATWYRENSCKAANPTNNHFGIFQINNGKYYTPGKLLTTGDIVEQAKDFINFSKHKREYYTRLKKLHTKFGKNHINISYLHYSILDLQLHSIAYNGITKGTHPTTNLYANANLYPHNKQSKDGVVTMTLKILKYLKDHHTTP